MIAALKRESIQPTDWRRSQNQARSATHAPSLDRGDELAIARTLRGELDAFNELVEKYERMAYSVAYRILQSSDAAGDAVQESFIKAYRGLPSFRNGSFKSWLMRIVVNSCYDSLRLNRRVVTESLSEDSYSDDENPAFQVADPQESPLAFVERMELRQQIERAIDTLPSEQRIVLVLSDIHGYSYQAISEITGMTMGTVKSRLNRARAKIRDLLLKDSDLERFRMQS